MQFSPHDADAGMELGDYWAKGGESHGESR